MILASSNVLLSEIQSLNTHIHALLQHNGRNEEAAVDREKNTLRSNRSVAGSVNPVIEEALAGGILKRKHNILLPVRTKTRAQSACQRLNAEERLSLDKQAGETPSFNKRDMMANKKNDQMKTRQRQVLSAC
jgi:hypothetical protein